MRNSHFLNLDYGECVQGFLYTHLPAFKSFYKCERTSKEKNCYFQSVYKDVVAGHSCDELNKGFAIEIMEEPLFFDFIRGTRKPERGYPLVRNPRFKPPAGMKFVNQEPFNAEDKLRFDLVKDIIFKQNKSQSLTPKRRPAIPRSTSTERKYSSVAKTPALASTKVPQTSTSVSTKMHSFKLHTKKRLDKFEVELHKADTRNKQDNLILPKDQRRELSPIVDPEDLRPDELSHYSKRLQAKHKHGFLKLSQAHATSLTDEAAIIEPESTRHNWLDNYLDKRLTPSEHELLYQDTGRKLDLWYQDASTVPFRDKSPVVVMSLLTDTQVQRLKETLKDREARGVITPRPVTERSSAARSKSRTKQVETLTKQQEDELLASPTRAKSRSPPRQSEHETDMEVDKDQPETSKRKSRPRKKKSKSKKRGRPESQPPLHHLKPFSRTHAEEERQLKRFKEGSRPVTPVRDSHPQTPPGLTQPGNQPFTLRRDLLMRIQVPRMSAFNSSPQCDFRIIEKVPNFACYTGALICDNSLGVNSNAQVHFMDEIATGQYALCNLEGIPVALAAITYSEGSPMSHISQAWRQFNPFGYPIYAWLFNINVRPYQVWYTFTLQKVVPPGVYRLIRVPHDAGDVGVEAHITLKNLDFGSPSFLKLSS